MLVCKHCGESCCIGKGYLGSYSTCNDELHKQLNVFYGEHEHGFCSDDMDYSDNARNHFAILEEGESLDALATDVVPKSEVEKIFEEIEKEIEEALKSNYEARRVYNPTDEFGMWVQGKIDALRGIEYFLAELKKKYTEEKK
jgi:hypothetical protein